MDPSYRSFSASLADRFARRPIHLLIVLDGFGLGKHPKWDAIHAASTPHLDRLFSGHAVTRLVTHGPFVGLPAAKDLGGSEVGHLTMGAGQILDQGPTRINQAIKDGSFFRSDALVQVMERCAGGGTLHLLGLLSDGNIHSHIDHFIALIRHAHEGGVKQLRLHILLDGRDVGIQTALDYVDQIEAVLTSINRQSDRDYRIASGGGRETITMDRDRQWNKMQAGWNAHVLGIDTPMFGSATEAIEAARASDKSIVDQDLPPFVVAEHGRPVGAMADGDAVININFRGDRAIQISQAFTEAGFTAFDRGRMPELLYAGMMVYDEDTNLPALQLMGPTKVDNPFGRRILEQGHRQFRLAETQKFAHVTFFFNGGYRLPLDDRMEQYQLINSDRGISFDDAPQMKAPEIAAQACQFILDGQHRFGLINFANTDMVGHTGNFDAAMAATVAVDQALGRIFAALGQVGGTALVTADHGNADEMFVTNKHGEVEASTKHSLNLVPAAIFDPEREPAYALRQPAQDDTVDTTPGLSHVAATNLVMLGEPVPEELQPALFVPR